MDIKQQKIFKEIPEGLSEEEQLEFAKEQIKIGNGNPFGLMKSHLDFANFYMYSGDVLVSGLKAGYKESSVGFLRNVVLNRDDVRLHLRLLHDLQDKESVADTNEVLEFLTSVMRGEKFEPIKVGKGKGEEVIQYLPPRITEQIKAGELLGKRYGAFDNDINVTMSAPIFTGGDEIED